MNSRRIFVLLAYLLAAPLAGAQSLNEIVNFREYSESFASAGQPTEEQFELIRDAGYDRVVYIAFSTDRDAIAGEDRLVRDLGMDYVQIPVVWSAPTAADFESFAAVMRQEPSKKTLLHCQVNFRASAFAFLYRVLEQGVPIADAKADMESVWQPNDTWRALIFDVLEAHDVAPECAGCDW
ncbi:MAG: protein tyrosine phosphatase family protein [Gammaproteobacteria bacterium]